jgi:hypothetical protein
MGPRIFVGRSANCMILSVSSRFALGETPLPVPSREKEQEAGLGISDIINCAGARARLHFGW